MMDNYIRIMIFRMARLTGTILSDRHFEILEYTYDYYTKNKVGPLYFNLKKHLNATKEEINELFPHGLNSVYSWVGVPIHSPDKSCEPVVKVDVPVTRTVYLDHNATTYIRSEVARVLFRYIKGEQGFANPSSSTLQGKKAYDLVSDARKKVAHILSVRADEIVFAGCGSEANNLLVKGLAFKNWEKKGHVITTAIEHPSILGPVRWLEKMGFDVTVLGVNRDGNLSLEELRNSIREDTIFVSVMAVNNEIGIINPLEKIGVICRDRNVPLIVDGVQGFGKLLLKPSEWGIAAMTFSGHKIYAPKGIGGLYLSHDLLIEPLIHGGGQEFGVRSGTENVGYIIALGEAAKLAWQERTRESERLTFLRNYFLERLKECEPGAIINGSLENRVPWNLSVSFPGVDSGALLLSLNAIGISVSAGSACSAGKIKTSHVLEAIKADRKDYGTLRISFGLKTTKDDLDYLFQYLPKMLMQLKKE